MVDTGGIVPDDKAAIPREILRQAQVAIEGASQLLLVVDVRAGLTPLDSDWRGFCGAQASHWRYLRTKWTRRCRNRWRRRFTSFRMMCSRVGGARLWF